MTISDTTSFTRGTALAGLEASRAAFLSAFASASDDALSYRAPGEVYALGGLLEHVAGVMRHYRSVLAVSRDGGFVEVRVPDAGDEQDLAAIAAGLTAAQRGDAIQRLTAAHSALVAEVERTAPQDFERKALVIYGSATEAYPTCAADIVAWVEQHYREHADHIQALLQQRTGDNLATLEIVERFGDVFNSHNVDAIMELMTEDCVFEDTEPSPDGTRYLGTAAVRGALEALFDAAPRAVFTTEEIFALGDRAVVRWRYDWGDGHVRGVDVDRVRDGKVSEKLAYVKG